MDRPALLMLTAVIVLQVWITAAADFCKNIECGEHGRCVVGAFRGECRCDAFWTGDRCQKFVDPCADFWSENICSNKKAKGYCLRESVFQNCHKTCGYCSPVSGPCVETWSKKKCSAKKAKGYCHRTSVIKNCPITCGRGFCLTVHSDECTEAIATCFTQEYKDAAENWDDKAVCSLMPGIIECLEELRVTVPLCHDHGVLDGEIAVAVSNRIESCRRAKGDETRARSLPRRFLKMLTKE